MFEQVDQGFGEIDDGAREQGVEERSICLVDSGSPQPRAGHDLVVFDRESERASTKLPQRVAAIRSSSEILSGLAVSELENAGQVDVVACR